MTHDDLVRERLHNHHLAAQRFATPAEVVGWMGAMQGQDYLAAKWAIGLRLPAATDADVEDAIRGRSVVRSWPLRGTLHFVAAADLRWILALMGPRGMARMGPRLRQLELDDTTLGRAHDALGEALRGGRLLTRAELAAPLKARGISTTGQRLSHILQHAQLAGLICYGAHRGRQVTFALLEEWVPPAPTLEREEALAKLVLRYFRGRGPATVRDFTWWSGLTVVDARAGIATAGTRLQRVEVDGIEHWTGTESADLPEPAPAAHLLPAFDEYVVAYRDRGAIGARLGGRSLNSVGGMLDPVVVQGGQVVGSWKRTLRAGRVVVSTDLAAAPRAGEGERLAAAAERYARFLGLELELR